MSTMSPEQRGDLAEQMLPTAAHLAVLVHGDGGPEDVREVLDGLDEAQKNALIVVLAGLVDPEQPVGKALGWLDFNEHGALTVPSWSEEGSVRDLAPEPDADLDDEYVDQVAVIRFMKGFPVDVTDAEFLIAVKQCVALEMSLGDVDRLRGWPARTAEKWVNRLRKQYQRSGREFPSLARPSTRVFTEAEVVAIRERSAAGASDLEIAVSYVTTRETIRSICRGQSYARYGGPIRAARAAHPSQSSRDYMVGHGANSQASGVWKKPVLTADERADVRQRTGDGESVKELAAEYEVSTNTIRFWAA
jgi:transposase-like protein